MIPIGQAGENLVKISITCIDKCGTVGRGGLPAVMGSKNLKAIVACQGNNRIEIADPKALTSLVDQLLERIKKWPGREVLINQGMSSMLYEGMGMDPRVYNNWTKGHMATQDELEDDQILMEEYRKNRKPLACSGCPLAEKDIVRVPKGRYAGSYFYGDHLIHMDMCEEKFGSAVDCSAMFNRYGIDVMDFYALVSFVTFIYQKGIISKEDLDGLEPKEKDYNTFVKLLEMIAYRKGLGAALAEGLAGAAQIIGKGAEDYSYHIKGHSTIFDPRARGILGTMEFTEITNPRGAHVAFGGSPAYTVGRSIEDFLRHGERMGIPRQAYDNIFDKSTFNVGRLSRYSEDWCSLFDCLGLCNRAFVNRFYHVQTISEIHSALTGNNLTPIELMKVAERVWNLWGVLNTKCGFARKDDRAPKIWFIPLDVDGKEISINDYFHTTTYTEEDIEKLLDDYYHERGWDKNSGIPTHDKLKELGLSNYALE